MLDLQLCKSELQQVLHSHSLYINKVMTNQEIDLPSADKIHCNILQCYNPHLVAHLHTSCIRSENKKLFSNFWHTALLFNISHRNKVLVSLFYVNVLEDVSWICSI